MTLLARTSIAVAAALICGVASADTINGLVNTGAGLSGGATDGHYTYTATGESAGLSGAGVVSNGSADPFPSWLPNDATSSWLIPTANQSTNYSTTTDSVFTWTLTFDLTGYDASSASFAGRWTSDNSGVLLFNGKAISSVVTNGYNSWTSFAATNGFLAGLNTLQFVVTDAASPTYNFTGLRAEFLSSAVKVATVAPAVPEPESYALMIAGLAAIGLLARRRKA